MLDILSSLILLTHSRKKCFPFELFLYFRFCNKMHSIVRNYGSASWAHVGRPYMFG